MFMQHVQFTVKKKITQIIKKKTKKRQLTLLQMKTKYFQIFNIKFMNIKTIYILEMLNKLQFKGALSAEIVNFCYP